MVWSVNWDSAFVVGGQDARRLTPNFRLREFRRADGSVRVHRELVSALQLLRNQFARGISVHEVADDGLAALITGAPTDGLLAAAGQLEAHHLFERVGREDERVRVRIPDPARLPAIGLEQALETAFSVTSGYETSGDKFQQVTGNFDGAGLSFGPAQVNFGTATLEPLFEKFREADEDELRRCFDGEDYDEWLAVLALPTRGEKVRWADAISTGSRKADVAEPWKGYLRAVGRVERFRAIMVEEILRKYGRRLLGDVQWLKQVRPDIEIDHLRCMCALYDVAIQQGGLAKAADEIRARVERDKPADQFELVRIAVEERGKRANRRWRADCISRRIGILDGVPTTITESGETSQRGNISFYMLRDVKVEDAATVTAQKGPKLDSELERVSRALATGSSLLV
jgi:hypothetical protein